MFWGLGNIHSGVQGVLLTLYLNITHGERLRKQMQGSRNLISVNHLQSKPIHFTITLASGDFNKSISIIFLTRAQLEEVYRGNSGDKVQ